ncbi:MAG: hypothetical protein Q9163_001321 [Psora crenata]
MAHLQLAQDLGKPPAHGQPYSIAVPGSEQDGRTPIYRNYRFKDGLLHTLDPNVGPHCPISNFVEREGHGADETRRWQALMICSRVQSLFTVSLYDTLGPSATEYIINHATLTCVITSLPHIPTLLKLKPRLPTLKIIISLDPLDNGEREGYSKQDLLNGMASELNVRVYSMVEVEALGASFGTPQYSPPEPTDIVTINYTSGTTGPPKGVTLLHKNAVASASSALMSLGQNGSMSVISYLPLAHIFARMIEHSALWAGGNIGSFHGDILALVDDLKALKPTTFISVPRLYNRFGSAIRAATVQQPGFKGALSRHIVNTKRAAIAHPDSPSATTKHALYDRIWGRKVASALGLQNTSTLVSGSAPLDPSLHEFFRVVLGTNFFQGYGLTETYSVGLCQYPDDLSVGSCGAVAPVAEVCLMDVPEMEYYSTDKPQPRGELLIRGSTLFAGYYRDPEETAKAMLPNGWFRTGDIGTVDQRGRFQIIDRVKNVLKLAQGEYVSPQRLENIYLSQMNYLAMAYVHGDSLQTFMVAIFAVQPDMFAPFASKVLGRSIQPTDTAAIKEACEDGRVKEIVKKELEKVGRANNFAGYERVRNFRLMVDPFTIENDLLTPTLKMKRPSTAKMYRKDIDELYSQTLAEDEERKKTNPMAKL